MPKPREIARKQRQAARDLATRDALALLASAAPSVPLPTDDALAAYRATIARYRKWLVRAHCSLAARSD